MTDHGFWIQTYTGKTFDLLRPTPEMVDIEDVAHALSNLCRYTGHFPIFYGVAQHSVLVSEQLPEELQLQGLLHDAAEAYVGDVASPLKKLMCRLHMGPTYESPYDQIEDRVWGAVAQHFGVSEVMDPAVKDADRRMLMTEKKLFRTSTKDWEDLEEAYDIHLMPWPPGIPSRALFLERFKELS